MSSSPKLWYVSDGGVGVRPTLRPVLGGCENVFIGHYNWVCKETIGFCLLCRLTLRKSAKSGTRVEHCDSETFSKTIPSRLHQEFVGIPAAFEQLEHLVAHIVDERYQSD